MAPGLLDPGGGLRGVTVVDVGDRDEVDVRPRQERVEELVAPAPGPDQAEPDLVVGGDGGRADARCQPTRPSRRSPPSPRRTLGA